MKKNEGENIFRKIYIAQREQEEEKKRVIEKIKEDKGLQAHVMSMYNVFLMFTLASLMISVGLICTNEIVERLGMGIVGIVFLGMGMAAYYVGVIRPLK